MNNNFRLISLILFSNFFLVVLSLDAAPALVEKRVYDLGDIQVEGDVRRPLIHIVEKTAQDNSYYDQLADFAFKEYENELLKPSHPPNITLPKSKSDSTSGSKE